MSYIENIVIIYYSGLDTFTRHIQYILGHSYYIFVHQYSNISVYIIFDQLPTHKPMCNYLFHNIFNWITAY